MKWPVVLAFGLVAGAGAAAFPVPAAALSLKVTPLDYKTTINKGEQKKGFIDITNPDSAPEQVHLSVMGFRQVDNNGALEFYESEQIASGIQLDYTDVEIGSRETLHLAFLLDGDKLPSGDVYGVIFASTGLPGEAAAKPSVRMGTLFSITNGTPTGRTAEITQLDVPFWQFGQNLTAHIDVKNTADPQQATGFYPDLTVSLQPYATKTVSGPLIFAGRTRTVEYRDNGNYFGPLLVSVKTGTSTKQRLVFAVTGYWRQLAPILLGLLVAAAFALRQLRRAVAAKSR